MDVTFRHYDYSDWDQVVKKLITSFPEDDIISFVDKYVSDLNKNKISFTIKEDWRDGKLFDVMVEEFGK